MRGVILVIPHLMRNPVFLKLLDSCFRRNDKDQDEVWFTKVNKTPGKRQCRDGNEIDKVFMK